MSFIKWFNCIGMDSVVESITKRLLARNCGYFEFRSFAFHSIQTERTVRMNENEQEEEEEVEAGENERKREKKLEWNRNKPVHIVHTNTTVTAQYTESSRHYIMHRLNMKRQRQLKEEK